MNSAAESVRVICRFRPQRDQLLRGGGQGGSSVPTGKGGLGHKSQQAAAASSAGPTGYKIDYAPDGKSLTYSMPGGGKGKPNLFTYDRIFGPESSQSDAFDAIAKETVADVLKGYNGSIFAYGQTGSGKTFTMFGPSGNHGMRGVIPRAADELFSGISSSDELEEVTIKCSFLEIYKENIRDLLQPRNTGLRIRELPTGEVYVQGLSDEYVASSQDIMQLLKEGEKSRSTAATAMNEVSSRSHSVLIVVVNQKLTDGSVRVGKLNLADLAGSERIERTEATGETLEEAKKINQSLSALGNCINALTDSKRTHTPFRDSTLTFLLKDSLGGNTKTTLLVCASPEENDCLETLSTLNFAKRAKKIKNSVSVNMKLGVGELTLMVSELRKELAIAHKTIVALQKTIRTMAAGGTIPQEMMELLLKPVTTSASTQAIEQVTSSEVASVPASMLAVALSSNSRWTELQILSPSLGMAGLLDDHELLPPASPSSAAPGVSASAPPPGDPVDSQPPSPRPHPDLHRASSEGTLRIEELSSAQAEISALRNQLEAEQQASEQRELEWAAERERLLAEVEALASSGAPAKRVQSPANGAIAIAIPGRTMSPAAAALAAISSSATADGALSVDADGSPRTPSAIVASVGPMGSPRSNRSVSVIVPSSSAAPMASPRSPPRPDPLLAILRAKNGRLEKQMAEMKETWTAYLDLIVENQKHQMAEKEEATRSVAAVEAAGPQRGPRVVKPVRANQKPGFFASLFRKSGTPNTPSSAPPQGTPTETRGSTPSARQRQSGGNYDRSGGVYDGALDGVYDGSSSRPSSAASSAFNSPAATHRRGGSVAEYDSTPQQGRSSVSQSASAAASPVPGLSRPVSQPIRHSHSASMGGMSPSPPPNMPAPSQHSFEGAIRIGYLSQRPAGLLSGLLARWTSSLFVLRPLCIDSYEIRGAPQADSLAAPSSSTPGSSPARGASPAPGAEPSPPSTSNLLSRPRGSIILDANTTVSAVSSSSSAADSQWAFDVVCRGAGTTKLCAKSELERHEWMKDILAVVGCLKRGVNPEVLIPANAGVALLSPSPSSSPDGAEQKFQLDPELVSNANFLLQNALDKLPAQSPDGRSPEAPNSAGGLPEFDARAATVAMSRTPEPPAAAPSALASAPAGASNATPPLGPPPLPQRLRH